MAQNRLKQPESIVSRQKQRFVSLRPLTYATAVQFLWLHITTCLNFCKFCNKFCAFIHNSIICIRSRRASELVILSQYRIRLVPLDCVSRQWNRLPAAGRNRNNAHYTQLKSIVYPVSRPDKHFLNGFENDKPTSSGLSVLN